MGVQLTGYVVVEVDGDELQIEASSFVAEFGGVWRYAGEGYTLLVTADLEAEVDEEGNFPTFVDEPELDGVESVEVIESELAAARGDVVEYDLDEEDGDAEDLLDEDVPED